MSPVRVGQRIGGHLPAAPLIAQVELRGGPAACGAGRTKALARAYSRGVQQGRVTFREGDVLAIRLLGLHPMLVWGDAWLEQVGRRPSVIRQDARLLTQRMAEVGISRRQLAQLLGRSESTVSNWCSGCQNIPGPELVHVADMLDCLPDDLRPTPAQAAA